LVKEDSNRLKAAENGKRSRVKDTAAKRIRLLVTDRKHC
jgi:hypothetical protein